MTFGLLDLPGPQFLGIYVGAIVVAHFAGKLLAQACRARHAAVATTPDLTPLESAYLAGGRARAVDAALVGMLQHQIIEVEPGGGAFKVGRGSWKSLAGLQADLYREISRRSGAIEKLRRLRSAALARMETRLANDDLLLVSSSGEKLCMRVAQTAPVAAVLALGAIKITIGLARAKPILFLVMLVIGAAILLGWKLLNLPLRSAQGEAALERLRRRNAALQATAKRRSADLDESSLMLAVGLFGTGVLVGTDLLWMQKAFASNRSSSSDGGGSSCGSSSGCGGGGGGGCGGCGG